MEECLRVGVIATTHGIKGEVKVFPTTDDLERFKVLKQCLLNTGSQGFGDEMIELEVEGVKFFKQFAILKFKGFDSINDIEKYKGKDLLVTRENAVELKENEHFITDLIGMEVIEENGTIVGELKDVMQTGANDVFVVTVQDGSEILLPYIEECVLDIDLDQNKITVYMMPGLV